ncbi:MAG: peroxiredoxin [Candidatus Magasanikbacteria bacterium CG10_big_fil_rev_8_21_14_0_10_43_6]|uniref:Peroxiredoxin n=1 Tax=Candidatus Magasanikbacteria bacterium CG10_big_fil_rev_8_21_14_0_10_43_6 TaxID=1974650 RepID=A0A2M6W0Z9_9BACT|nr:MAG: peroxiredoxin [Candidatus Magasanikbacteria bacterium CG10_big_fil_rev_8_21_14_0_10_43_6]
MSHGQCCAPQSRKTLINTHLPEMTVDVFHNNEIKSVHLSDYRGKWVILFFYPADFTFVCPTELEEVAELYPAFQDMNTEVISVSTDTAFVHKAWHDTSPSIKKVGYPMAADPTGALCKAMGTYIEAEGLSYRASVIINPDGIIKAYEMHDNSIGRSGAELLRKMQAAQYVNDHAGQVCPAKWKPGADTLEPGVDLVGKI